VGKIAEKSSLQECIFDNIILSAELTKWSPSDCVFGDFAHWKLIIIDLLRAKTNPIYSLPVVKEALPSK